MTLTATDRPNSLRSGPDGRGRFGGFGGRFVAETLMPLVLSVEAAYEAAKQDPGFQLELDRYLKDYVGRPSPLWFAERLTKALGGAKIYFKRDELNHTGSHKINNCMGQILLANRMGKTRIIAETGAGQHGVATATVCALFGLPCTIYMGATDVERQAPNVFRMKLLGAEVVPVSSGAGTLKDAMNDAMRDWVANVADTYYLIGTVAGPHPYPAMVRDFQSIIGTEARKQMLAAEGRLPDVLVAAIGGGSNAMGLFHPFLDDPDVRLMGVEAAGHGLDTKEHAASLSRGRPGVLHGNRTYLLQDEDGQITEAHSISAGLDYPGIGPEHSWLHEIGRVEYLAATDQEALDAFQLCCRTEGIIPALEPAHALAHVMKVAPGLPADSIVLMNMCGRGGQGHLRGGRTSGREAVSRIAARFALLRQEGRRALIPFLEAYDPDEATSTAILHGMPGAGADLIEIGMPFTDPMADGPTIQTAGLRGLKAGATLAKTLAMVAGFREMDADTPVILMGYLNPILSYGADRFCTDAAKAGVDGLIVVDLPSEEADWLSGAAASNALDIIRLVAPTTDDARLPQVLQGSSGFVYYVSITGITGTRTASAEHLAEAIPRVRRATDLPIAVGFGIRTPAQAAEAVRVADAVVVASALIDTLAASLDADGRPAADSARRVLEQVRDLAAGVRAVRG